MQAERWRNKKPKITPWYTMMDKMKEKFLSNDCRVQLYKKMKGTKQKDMDVQRYTKEFLKLDIRESHNKNVDDKIAMYMGGA